MKKKLDDSIKSRLAEIEAYQRCPWVHPFTCGVDSKHGSLTPHVEGDAVLLRCPTCGWFQMNVPMLPEKIEMCLGAWELDPPHEMPPEDDDE